MSLNWDDASENVWVDDISINYCTAFARRWGQAGGSLRLLLNCVADDTDFLVGSPVIEWSQVRKYYAAVREDTT